MVMLDLLFGAEHRDRLLAISDCQLICRPVADFEEVVASDARISRAVFRRLAQDTEWLREGLTAIGRMDAQQCLLTFLYQTRARLTDSGRENSDPTRFSFPMNQQQLADAIGVTSIHVNRVLGTLRRAGVLTIAQGEVEVRDMAEFERLGGAHAP